MSDLTPNRRTSMLPLEHAVIDIGEYLVTTFKIGKPFRAYVVAAQSLIYGRKIPQGVFDLMTGILGAFLAVQEGGTVRCHSKEYLPGGLI